MFLSSFLHLPISKVKPDDGCQYAEEEVQNLLIGSHTEEQEHQKRHHECSSDGSSHFTLIQRGIPLVTQEKYEEEDEYQSREKSSPKDVFSIALT